MDSNKDDNQSTASSTDTVNSSHVSNTTIQVMFYLQYVLLLVNIFPLFVRKKMRQNKGMAFWWLSDHVKKLALPVVLLG